MHTMTTVSEVLSKLKSEGYTVDFNLKENCLVCGGDTPDIDPEDFVVDRHFRSEGVSDPGDEAIVYAISSEKHGLKGTLINAYGVYSDPLSARMIKALAAHLGMANARWQMACRVGRRWQPRSSRQTKSRRGVALQHVPPVG